MQNERILIIGGTGSLGHELTSHFISCNVIGILSRDENKQWIMRREYPKAEFFIGDVRDKISMIRAITKFRPTVIIFAAAQKHIDICEREVSESINTNISGIRNLIEILEFHDFVSLHTVLFISTDKACNPVNVYGQCKAIAEKLMIEASKILTKIKFVCVRYGNVINSRGSLIPLFKEIAQNSDRPHFTVTSTGMTRFFMSLSQAANLIETSITRGASGEIWIFLASAFHIDDIARYFSESYNKPVSIIGIRPGEKMHEELFSAEEESRSRRDGVFVIIEPTPSSGYLSKDHAICTGLRSNMVASGDYEDNIEAIRSMIIKGAL